MMSLNGVRRSPGARRRSLLRALTGGLAALLLAVAAPGPAGAQNADAKSDEALAEEASRYIVELSETAIAQLSPEDISAAERAERARQLLEENFAGRDLARFVLGRYWRVASEEQQQRFMTLLREVALTRFLPTFQHLSMDQVTIERAIADPQAKGVARVITRVDVPDRAPVKLAWRVRPTEGVRAGRRRPPIPRAGTGPGFSMTSPCRSRAARLPGSTVRSAISTANRAGPITASTLLRPPAPK